MALTSIKLDFIPLMSDSIQNTRDLRKNQKQIKETTKQRQQKWNNK